MANDNKKLYMINVESDYFDKSEMRKYIEILTKTITNDTSLLGEYVFNGYLSNNIDSDIIDEKCKEIDKNVKLLEQIKKELEK